jgi:sortase A
VTPAPGNSAGPTPPGAAPASAGPPVGNDPGSAGPPVENALADARPDAPGPAEQPAVDRPPPLGPIRRTVRETGLGLITLGVVVLLFVAYQLLGTNLTEARNQSQLARQFKTSVQRTTTTTSAPTPSTTAPPTTTQVDALPSVPPGGAIDHLLIPAIGVDKYVVEGTDEAALRRGPGHYAGTAYPGQTGNAAIAGHRTTYGAPFFELNQMKPGQHILLTDLNDHTWDYVVDQPPRVVNPDDVSVLNPTPFPQLTLTTCNPRFSATSRLVVFARLKGQASAIKVTAPAPTAPVRPAVLPGDDTSATTVPPSLGGGQSGAWLPALLYGMLTIGLWIATRLTINRTRRWRRVGAYVVGIGATLIPLWFCFENVILLLPQSI